MSRKRPSDTVVPVTRRTFNARELAEQWADATAAERYTKTELMMMRERAPRVTLLDLARVSLRGAAINYEAESTSNGGEALALDRAALMYARELLAVECGSAHFQAAIEVLDRYADRLKRE